MLVEWLTRQSAYLQWSIAYGCGFNPSHRAVIYISVYFWNPFYHNIYLFYLKCWLAIAVAIQCILRFQAEQTYTVRIVATHRYHLKGGYVSFMMRIFLDDRSELALVAPGVSQGSHLGPLFFSSLWMILLFHYFLNSKCTLMTWSYTELLTCLMTSNYFKNILTESEYGTKCK